MSKTLAVGLTALAMCLGPADATAQTPAGAPSDWPQPVADSSLGYLALVDQLEFRSNDGDDLWRWDAEGWLGGDYNKLWLKTEGEKRASGPPGGDAELQILYGRTFARFWDFQIGVRQDVVFGSGPDRERTLAVVGVQGLAPYWFEVTPALFIRGNGDVSARFTATYDLLFSQRLIAQARFEANAAGADARKFGIESGLNDVELGLRIRYEIRRELAPYVGVNWLRKLGDTADLARKASEGPRALGFVVGIRLWF